MDLAVAKQKSIVDYLERCGVDVRKNGTNYICSSPFSSDSNPSFVIYPGNYYHDYSTGSHGTIIDLVMNMHTVTLPEAIKIITREEIKAIDKSFAERVKKVSDFNIMKYINTNDYENREIERYAYKRGITEGYYYGKFYRMVDNVWVRVPSMMYVHTDENGLICGAKFRAINAETSSDRFTSRGRLRYYVLDNILDEDPTLFICESESSSNSLWMWLRSNDISAVVVSFGSVSSIPRILPTRVSMIPERRIIIDYDGSEDKYQDRISRYSHFDGYPVKLKLKKGDDINSLYNTNQLNKYAKQILP